jgi:ATP-dependent DNA helicase RecG
MTSDERNDVMRRFKAHEFDVLVSTTVIEVGVDVPNATVMAIENSERFGLSQLHQLRGRVGRGSHKSYCVLVTESAPPGARRTTATEESGEEGVEDESPWVRLRVLEQSRSGFDIAEHDLKIRGPGDFFGTKQSGSPTFRLADMSRDAKLLELAREEAHRLYDADPQLAKPAHAALGRWFRGVLDEAAVTLKSG